MKKQGPGFSAKWQTRWFEQKGNRLYYYKPSSLSFSLADGAPSPAGDDSPGVSPRSPRSAADGDRSRPLASSSRSLPRSSSRSKKVGGIALSERIPKASADDGESRGAAGNGQQGHNPKGNRSVSFSGSASADEEDEDDQPPLPNPRGFIDIKRASAIVGRANDVNAAKNQEKEHYQFDLYTAERVFHLAATTEVRTFFSWPRWPTINADPNTSSPRSNTCTGMKA